MAEYIDKTAAIDIMNAKAEMGVCSEYAAFFCAAEKMLELFTHRRCRAGGAV